MTYTDSRRAATSAVLTGGAHEGFQFVGVRGGSTTARGRCPGGRGAEALVAAQQEHVRATAGQRRVERTRGRGRGGRQRARTGSGSRDRVQGGHGRGAHGLAQGRG